jgi:flagellar hook protein FlgE
MTLFSALQTGVTGLGTNGLSMQVLGDNISNLNTVGFKGSRADFQDVLLQSIGTKGQLGAGASTARISQNFGQGSLVTSTMRSDLAIDGKGFFVLNNAEGNQFYSRAGQFRLNNSGNLISMDGLKLQGYQTVSSGVLGTAVGDIEIATEAVPGAATTTVIITANLDASATAAATITSPPLDFATIANEATFTSSTVVYDSLGVSHDVTMAFYKTGTNTWIQRSYIDAGEAGGTPGVPQEISDATLNFTTAGALDPLTSTVTATAVTFEGAAAQTVAFDLGDTVGDSGVLTQFDTPTSNVYDVDPDGNSSGDFVDFDISDDGTVSGIYSNGTSRVLAKVVLATFRAQSNLSREGHNLYAATRDSGEAVIGDADTGGRGSVHSFALEGSNIDLEREFVTLIKSQKGYQASARLISSVDDLLQELMQIV